jgi:hypothetical protein
VTRIVEIALAAALVCGAATVALAGSPAGAQAITPSAAVPAAPETVTRPVPSALASTASAQPVSKGWRWEVQRLGRRVIRVMPER